MMIKSTPNQIPQDVKQICLWLTRGYERRKLTCREASSDRSRQVARERERMEAVEQALAFVGSDIPSEDVREQLRAAILLNVESGRAYPYERLELDAISRPDFYRRRDRFLADIALCLGLA